VSCRVFSNPSITKDKKATSKNKNTKMSLQTRLQLDDVVAANVLLSEKPGDVVPARALTARKAGAGPTSALGVESSAVTSAGALVVTATNGLVVPPVYLGAITSAQSTLYAASRAAALQITKSGTTYVFADTLTTQLTLTFALPLATTSAGFKARFLVSTALTSGATINIYTATGSTAGNKFVCPLARIGGVTASVASNSTLLTWNATGTSAPGDVLDFECDGLNWHVSGYSASSAVACTAPTFV
jgi:hypothetical protein